MKNDNKRHPLIQVITQYLKAVSSDSWVALGSFVALLTFMFSVSQAIWSAHDSYNLADKANHIAQMQLFKQSYATWNAQVDNYQYDPYACNQYIVDPHAKLKSIFKGYDDYDLRHPFEKFMLSGQTLNEFDKCVYLAPSPRGANSIGSLDQRKISDGEAAEFREHFYHFLNEDDAFLMGLREKIMDPSITCSEFKSIAINDITALARVYKVTGNTDIEDYTSIKNFFADKLCVDLEKTFAPTKFTPESGESKKEWEQDNKERKEKLKEVLAFISAGNPVTSSMATPKYDIYSVILTLFQDIKQKLLLKKFYSGVSSGNGL